MKQKSFLRRVVFQVHLWGGLALGLYAFLIGITGSVLVFHAEILERMSPRPRVAVATAPPRLEAIRDGIASHYQGWHVWGLEAPLEAGDPWRSHIQQGSRFRTVYADSEGRVVGELESEGTWLHLAERFHSVLLIPRGRLLNGIAGLGVVGLAVSGLVLWWPGRGAWSTAFRIVRRSSWKGLTYDLHRVGGAIALGAIVLFGVTGGYFTWPAVYRGIAASVLPTSPKPPVGRVSANSVRQPVDDLVAAAERIAPGATLLRVLVPAAQDEPVTVILAHGSSASDRRTRTSQFILSPYTAEVLSADDFRARGAGDHLVNWIAPLHAGSFGGIFVKVLWALGGLMLPFLFVTGFLMWCNRVLAPRLRRFRPQST